jgi:GntR family transcriptional regulator/MocR family aminotransferase
VFPGLLGAVSSGAISLAFFRIIPDAARHDRREVSITAIPELLIRLDSASREPLHRQVYQGIREAILSGQVAAGVRIPASRRLAEYLAVSRSTVLVAFEQLVAEGYIEGAVGSGSYVARQIPDHLLRAPAQRSASAPVPVRPPRLSARGRDLASLRGGGRPLVPYPRAFWTGVPPVDVFPLAVWSRLAARRLRSLTTADLYHGPAAGYAALRQAIVAHLGAARGMHCDPDQVLVLSSAQEALELSCRVLLDPGDGAWMENPGWSGARGALVGAGARLTFVPVDAAGLDVSRGLAEAPDARIAYVSPSHQYPTGATLSLERRMALLDWAANTGAWILEDDYDSEFRYAGRPLTALHGLDTASRVLYVGTFNKTIFPALRVGYLVVPSSLIEPFLAVRRIGGQHSPTIDQAVLTDFMAEGHYVRHLRRSRAACQERRDTLLAALERHAGGLLELGGAETGLHAIGWLPVGTDDVRASEAAARSGVMAAPLSGHCVGPCLRPGLVLGYAGIKPHEINAATRRLGEALSGMVPAKTNGSFPALEGPPP